MNHTADPGESSGTANGGSLSVDTLLEGLSHPIRREVIDVLSRTDARTVSVDELVQDLEPVHDQSTDGLQRRPLGLLLHHIHLPALADLGVVEFDYRRGLVRYHRSADVEDLLDDIHSWQSR